MLSERLVEFLENCCHLDADPEDTAELLHGPDGAYYRDWLPKEFGQAIRAHEITPEFMSDVVSLHFDDQHTLDQWLRRRWTMWFTEPYPGN